MARTAAGQVSARRESFASCRAVMMTAALIVALVQFADVHRANAQGSVQFVPMGPPQQAPFPTYAPYPPAGPPGQVAEPPMTRRAERVRQR